MIKYNIVFLIVINLIFIQSTIYANNSKIYNYKCNILFLKQLFFKIVKNSTENEYTILNFNMNSSDQFINDTIIKKGIFMVFFNVLELQLIK